MFNRRTITTYCLALLFAGVFFQSCSKDNNAEVAAPSVENQLISVDLAQDFEQLDESMAGERGGALYSFRTLNQALICTGLNAAVFSGFKTIYAPSDFAFAKLGLDPSNVCDALDAQTLSDILLYHVTDGTVSTRDRGCLTQIDGNIAQLSDQMVGRFRRVFINETRIISAFNLGGRMNSLRIYVLTDVLQVPDQTIVETAIGADQFSVLVSAVLAADPAIAAALSDPDQIFTLFAPTNEAFLDLLAALNLSSLDDLVAAIGVDGLSTVLLYHVVDGCAFSNDLSDGQTFTTLQGEMITVDLNNLGIQDKTMDLSPLDVNGLNIRTSNGIVHTIGKVLLPDAILQNL